MENPIELIEAHKKRVEKINGDEIDLPPNGTSLTLLQLVYRNAALPLVTRMRAAVAALPMEHPRLAVTAQITERDFAVLLDERLENLKRLEQDQANGKVIEAAPSPPVEVKPPMPRLADRRYRRF
jgi:hypothetical protein